VDDEVIQKGANLLLTFKNVRNEAGKGSAIFDRATASAVDLSAAGFGSVDSASKTLGKALNDPVKGISALGRAGVTFTADQKKMIAGMVAQGDTLGAQKIILGEVESQVGGVGAASATAGEKAAVLAGNLKEQLGTALLPTLDKFAGFFTTTLGPAISKGLDAAGPIIDQVGTAVVAVLNNVGPAIGALKGFLGPIIGQVQTFVSSLSAGGAGGGVASFFAGLGAVVSTVLPIVRTVVGTVLGVITTMAPTIAQIASSVGSALSSIASIIGSVFRLLAPIVLPILKTVLGTVIAVVGAAVKVVAAVLKVVAALLKGDWSGAWHAAGGVVSAVVGLIKTVAVGAFNIVKAGVVGVARAFSGAWSAVKSATAAAWSAVKGAVSRGVSDVVAKVKALPGKAKSALGNLASRLLSAGGDLIRGFADGIARAASAVIDAAKRVAGDAVNAVKSALGIRSPSRVFRQIGRFVGAGLEDGLTGSAAGVRRTAGKLAGLLGAAFREQGAGRTETRAFLAGVRADTDQLERIARQRTKLAGQISSAQVKLKKLTADYLKTSKEYRDAVVSSARSYASIVGAGDDGANVTGDTLVQGLRDKYAAMLNFTGKIKQLTARGLNSATIDQIVQAGVEGGTATLDALSAATPAALAEVNRLQASIARQSTKLGDAAGMSMYGAGVRAQQGLIEGLTSNSRALEAAAATIADKLVSTVKTRLAIRSPSRVFRELGTQTVAGLQLGLDPREVGRRGAQLAGALVDGFASPALAAGVAGRGAGNTYNVTVQVPRGATNAEVGREVVTYIKAYERESGRAR
jgi:phage-related protein